MEEKAEMPQAGEEQPVIAESGSMVFERQTLVTDGQFPGGKDRLVKGIGDLGGRVLDSVGLPQAELKVYAQKSHFKV